MEEMTFEKLVEYLQVKKRRNGVPAAQMIEGKTIGKCESVLRKSASESGAQAYEEVRNKREYWRCRLKPSVGSLLY